MSLASVAAPALTRRSLIAGAVAALAGGALWSVQRAHASGTLLSAYEDVRGDQFIGGIQLETGKIFGARIPMRAHGCAIDPTDPQRVMFFARRPGTRAFEYRRDTQQVRTAFTTPDGRHLAGHGVFSHDGQWLYTPEHDYAQTRGWVIVRDARTFATVAAIDTQGIDPHEIAWAPGTSRLLVANGGILTHPRTFRRKLNIDTMDPSFCVIDTTNGTCLEQWRLPDHLLSIRHLAVTHSGMAAIGLQYEGEITNAPGIVALYRPAQGLQLLTAPREERARHRGYVASVAVNETNDLVAAACPYGDGVACWSLQSGEYLGFITAGEAYGIASLEDDGMIASQRDGSLFTFSDQQLRSRVQFPDAARRIRWDDHWVRVATT